MLLSTDSDVMRILAPAKVNLYLRVVGRHVSGLHLLESVMVPVSLFDTLVVSHFELFPGSSRVEVDIITDSTTVPSGRENLADMAARAFADATGVGFNLAMSIEKRIPSGAGLGGGSSDAAATLALLNEVSGRPLADMELRRMALKLGSDVPFFLASGAQRIGGIGDEIEPYHGPLPSFLVLCSDETHLSTAEVFRMFDSLTSAKATSRRPGSVIGRLDPLAIGNDLEDAARVLHPGVGAVKESMRAMGLAAVTMTGSGSVIFGVVEEWGEAARIADELRSEGFWSTAVEVLG